jgi:hypothetical protein
MGRQRTKPTLPGHIAIVNGARTHRPADDVPADDVPADDLGGQPS